MEDGFPAFTDICHSDYKSKHLSFSLPPGEAAGHQQFSFPAASPFSVYFLHFLSDFRPSVRTHLPWTAVFTVEAGSGKRFTLCSAAEVTWLDLKFVNQCALGAPLYKELVLLWCSENESYSSNNE